MSIRNKIIYGYGITLSIAIVGNVVGLTVGNHYQQKALQASQTASRERNLINILQVDILYNRPAKQLSPHLRNPEKFKQESSGLIDRVEKIKLILNNQNNSAQPVTLEGLQTRLEEYEIAVNKFYQKAREFAQKVQPLTTTETGALQAEKLLVALVKSQEFVGFIEFPDQLKNFSEEASKREELAQLALVQAEKLRTQIYIISLCLSVAIALLLAIYTSRAISRPIQAITNIAEQITRESNFDLQLPKNMKDETGILAASINELIQKVKKLIEEQIEYSRQLEESKELADQANHAKSEFLANMSHELRTPLNGVLGYSQILARTPLIEEQKRGIEIIYQCGSHLLTLINDILDLAKIEANKMQLDPVPCYLPSVLQSVAEVARIKSEYKSLDFIYQIPENLPLGVVLDEKRLRQILLNLLGNAIKFTERGKIIFRVIVNSDSSVNTETNIILNFQIEDTGIGMSKEQIEKIFLPFEQVGTIQKQTEGTGLGLAISKTFVEMMNSNLQVRSQEGIGSIFSFELECPLADDWYEANTLTSLGKIISYSGKKRRILVVDDRWENRSVLVNLLTPLVFTVIQANNGEEALQNALENKPDLIISDLKMPIMDGWEMLNKLRTINQLKDINVIVSSASVFDSDREKSITAGGQDFLPKPVQVEELYRLLSKHLSLEWIYSEDEEKIQHSNNNVSDKNTNIQLIIPPASELEELAEYAMQGQIKEMQKELARLVDKKETFRPFADKINQMIKGYKISQARDFLRKSMSQ